MISSPQPASPDLQSAPADGRPVENALLIEAAWEVCNQVGGIYTVIRSKVPSMIERWGDNYLLIGPYVHANVSAYFDPVDDESGPFGQAVRRMRDMGFEVHYGRWLVTGKPRVVLFNPQQMMSRLGEIKYELWNHHAISIPDGHSLMDQVVAFGFLIKNFFLQLAREEIVGNRQVIGHIHEWMAATAIPGIRRNTDRVRLVFTTHATLLGRYLAMNDQEFYSHLPFYDWEKEARHFGVTAETQIERAAAHGSHIFSTVSSVTGRECERLLGRKPDVIVPNGLNIRRFHARHEVQNLHQKYKTDIERFVMGHFFCHTPFDLNETLYFFTSGRYEHSNKGFDLTLEALARLNHRLKAENSKRTVVMFFVTRAPVQSINPQVLEARALLEEIEENCRAIEKQLGDRLFVETIKQNDNHLPDFNELTEEYWRLRLRRSLQIWKSKKSFPPVITHNLVDDSKDPILNFLRRSGMVNKPEDRVKIVFHPEFINSTNPLFGIEYPEFVRGCNLGVFPSYYEPWGYTPLECMASGVPAVTSNLAGFGDYCLQAFGNTEPHGLYVINRRVLNYNDAAEQLAQKLHAFATSDRRFRINQRYKVEDAALHFEWSNLCSYYDRAHQMAAAK